MMIASRLIFAKGSQVSPPLFVPPVLIHFLLFTHTLLTEQRYHAFEMDVGGLCRQSLESIW